MTRWTFRRPWSDWRRRRQRFLESPEQTLLSAPPASISFKGATAVLTAAFTLVAPAARIDLKAANATLSRSVTAPAAKVNFKGATPTLTSVVAAPAAKINFKAGTAILSVKRIAPAAKVNFKGGTATLTKGVLLTAPAAKINFKAGVPKLSIARTAPAAKINFKAGTAELITAVLDDVYSLTEFYNLQVRIDVKQITDSGSAETSASGPTTVEFNKVFKDVDSIVATVQETTEHFVVIDFLDVPDPTEFDVYVFDGTGTQVSKTIYWIARGIG